MIVRELTPTERAELRLIERLAGVLKARPIVSEGKR